MAVYKIRKDSLFLTELPMYGEKRFGVIKENRFLMKKPTQNGMAIPMIITAGKPPAKTSIYPHGKKHYETTDWLGNVRVTYTDKKSWQQNKFALNVSSSQDYYPFGSVMEGRKYNLTAYRFAFNTQERLPELNESHYTALYWEYDGRLARRWNRDPKPSVGVSDYAVNGNSPVFYLDPKGDFKTKFGAYVYKLFHGGKVYKAMSGKHKGEYYVTKTIYGEKGEKGDGRSNLDEYVVSEKITWNWGKEGKSHPGDVLDESLDYVQKNASKIWYSPLARYYISDYYTLSVSFQTSSGVYLNEELTFTLLLRGEDPGLYFNSTTGFGGVSSIGVDVGMSVGKGYYLGDAREMSSRYLSGWLMSGNVGVGIKAIAGGGVNADVDVGLNEYGKPKTITGKIGIYTGLGVSTPVLQGGFGAGKATRAIPIIKF
ncbi:MAG: hypothetical protein KatS3mg035_2055 [Bacteroidia bacterium]|nr:MAG: hypothetical protein KatS3mg035_2055 [Bacteroidia bacterium]